MELMCDYFDAGYEVLYNYGMTDITNLDGLINFIEDMLKKDKKILVAIDNSHKEKTHSIFYFIDKVSNSQPAKKLKIIMTARKPDFGWLLNGLEKVEEEIRKSIRKLSAVNLCMIETLGQAAATFMTFLIAYPATAPNKKSPPAETRKSSTAKSEEALSSESVFPREVQRI